MADPSRLFNVALVSHGGAGKTSLAEAVLFKSGAVNRLGKVEDGSSTTDFDPDELKRHMSVSLALAPLDWRDAQINVIDAPGYADFFGDLAIYDGPYIRPVMDDPDEFVRDGFSTYEALRSHAATSAPETAAAP